MQCSRCGTRVQDDWIACPKCGLSLEAPSPEVLIGRVVTKLIGGMVEAGFLTEQEIAEEEGDHVRAKNLEIGRKVSKDIEYMISEALETYDYQDRVKRLKEKKE